MVLTIISNDTIEFRVFELIVKVAGSSDKGFEMTENQMLLDEIISEAKSDDILIKINAIEMLTEVRDTKCCKLAMTMAKIHLQISATSPGYQFLKKTKLLEFLVGVMKHIDAMLLHWQ